MDPDPRSDDLREPPLPADMLTNQRQNLRQLQRAMLLMESLAELETDDDGLFIAYLKAGVYTLVPVGPVPPPPGVAPEPIDVRVEKKQFTPVTVAYDCGAI
jgi:hypothetical protein